MATLLRDVRHVEDLPWLRWHWLLEKVRILATTFETLPSPSEQPGSSLMRWQSTVRYMSSMERAD